MRSRNRPQADAEYREGFLATSAADEIFEERR